VLDNADPEPACSTTRSQNHRNRRARRRQGRVASLAPRSGGLRPSLTSPARAGGSHLRRGASTRRSTTGVSPDLLALAPVGRQALHCELGAPLAECPSRIIQCPRFGHCVRNADNVNRRARRRQGRVASLAPRSGGLPPSLTSPARAGGSHLRRNAGTVVQRLASHQTFCRSPPLGDRRCTASWDARSPIFHRGASSDRTSDIMSGMRTM